MEGLPKNKFNVANALLNLLFQKNGPKLRRFTRLVKTESDLASGSVFLRMVHVHSISMRSCILMEDVFLLFSHCIIVFGANRSTICDLQRNKILLIPNSFAELFSERRWLNINQISQVLDLEGREVLKEYEDFLVENELGFYATDRELELFPKLNDEWLFPATISNCILDTNTTFRYFNESFLKGLNTAISFNSDFGILSK